MTGDMEEGPSKERRNLVAMSTVILLVAFLRVPQPDEVLFGTLHLQHVDPQRLWLAASLALGYLTFRFLFAPSIHEAWKGWRETVSREIDEAVRYRIRLMIEQWALTRGNTDLLKFSNTPPLLAEGFMLGGIMEVQGPEQRWEKTYVVQMRQSARDGKTLTADFASHCKVAPTFRMRLLAAMRGLRRARAFDWMPAEFVFPIVWAGAAALVCIQRLLA